MTGFRLRRVVALSIALIAAASPLVMPSRAATVRTTDAAVDRFHPGGEPQIAVNPRDPSNLVVGDNVDGISYSLDGGERWTHVDIPNIGDNVLGVEPDGTFLFSDIDGAVHASRDGGRSWTKVGNWVGAAADILFPLLPPLPYPANVGAGDVVRQFSCDSPSAVGAGPVGIGSNDPGVTMLGCDRPWLATDPQTGRAYLSFSVHSDASGGLAPGVNPADQLRGVGCRASTGSSTFQCGRQYVSASGDGGRTWTAFRPMDSRRYPHGVTNGWSGGPAASFGVLAAAYVSVGAGCPTPCIVFETSLDDGASWARHVVAGVRFPAAPNGLSTSFNFSPYVAADPSRRGSYAVMVFDRSQKRLLVYVTRDSGRTWRQAALAETGTGVSRWTPWIAHGPSGALGVTWRTAYSDGSFDAWAAVARAGDTRFAPPVRLSSSRSPGPVAPGGDDNADITLTRTTLYAVWGDQRGGPAPTGWFGSATNHVGSYRFASGP